MVRSEWNVLAAAILAAIGLSPAAISQGVQARPDDARFALFDATSPDSNTVLDHGIIDRILAAFVVGDGTSTSVRYAALKGEGLRVMKQLFAGFGGFDTAQLNVDEQLAYWLNLRLLMVLHATGEAYPGVKPDKLLTPDSAASTTPMVNVQGVRLSIADVDRIILRKARANSHIVYGLVVPVREGPAFPRVAFRGATVHAALDAAGRTFVNRRGSIKLSKQVATIPRFFAGYRTQLGQEDAALLAHIKALAAPKFAIQLASVTQLSENRKLTLNNFVERNFVDLAGPTRHNTDNRGGAGS